MVGSESAQEDIVKLGIPKKNITVVPHGVIIKKISNKVLKENTGKTTTDLISSRVIQEAKILLKQTDWNISEIAYSLGFEEVAHFSNFFRKQTSFPPLGFRS